VRHEQPRSPQRAGNPEGAVPTLRQRGVPGLVAIHCPNGGWRSPIEAKILQSLGVTAGVPDVLLWHDAKSFALELKSETGRTTEQQLEMLNRLSEAGVYTAICHGLDRALAVLEAWNLLRGATQ
jgi:VRR-NUC domain